jgi:hypothetical protein
VIEHDSGARRALQWFLNRSDQEPSDRDLQEFKRFLELMIDGERDHVTLPDWERARGTAPEALQQLN